MSIHKNDPRYKRVAIRRKDGVITNKRVKRSNLDNYKKINGAFERKTILDKIDEGVGGRRLFKVSLRADYKKDKDAAENNRSASGNGNSQDEAPLQAEFEVVTHEDNAASVEAAIVDILANRFPKMLERENYRLNVDASLNYTKEKHDRVSINKDDIKFVRGGKEYTSAAAANALKNAIEGKLAQGSLTEEDPVIEAARTAYKDKNGRWRDSRGRFTINPEEVLG